MAITADETSLVEALACANDTIEELSIMVQILQEDNSMLGDQVNFLLSYDRDAARRLSSDINSIAGDRLVGRVVTRRMSTPTFS